MRNAVVTITMGENYKNIARMTHPSLKAYADRIGAEFVVLDEPKLNTTSPHWEKFQIYYLLNQYDRIIFLDTDMIVRPDCPNLFDVVPYEKLGAVRDVSKSYAQEMDMACKTYNVVLKEWNGKYYNTGVIVLSRVHKFLFKKPAIETWNYYEQTYLNMRIAETGVDVHELEYRYNRTSMWDHATGEHRLCSNIVHYAGVLNNLGQLIPADLDKWDKKEHERLNRHFCLAAFSKLGDNLCAEPVFRYMIEKAYPSAEYLIAVKYPEAFQHLSGRAEVVEFSTNLPYKPDTPYLHFNATALRTDPSRTWIDGGNMHYTDWVSLMFLRQQLPLEDKRIKQQVTLRGISEMLGLVESPQDAVIVHPGKGWPSKTFPKAWWDEVLEGLSSRGHRLVLIGKKDQYTGHVDVKVPAGACDLRELLSIEGMVALISKSRVLLSNDSAPIHIAGAFDNWIVVIPTIKHPDLILPFRRSDRYWRTKFPHKRLLRDLMPRDPAVWQEDNLAEFAAELPSCLPDPEHVVEVVEDCRH